MYKKRIMVAGMFNDRKSAETAYNDLRKRGYEDNEIHLIMSETDKGDVTEAGNAIISTLAAISTLVPVPGIGLMMTGPIAASFAEDGTENSENIIAALTDQGISDDFARKYESGIKEGCIVLGVEPHSDKDAEILSKQWEEEMNAEYIYKQAIT